MDNPNQNNPFDALYDMVGPCDTFEEQVGKIMILLENECISKELNATLLADVLSMPILAAQNVQLANAVKDLQDKLERILSTENPEPKNIILFPKNAIIN